jgi:voltage-gated potassium channel
LDSLYFSLITLTTVGYGDFSPTKPLAKIFTMVYILVGIGVLIVFIEKLARSMMEERQPRFRRASSPDDDDSGQDTSSSPER